MKWDFKRLYDQTLSPKESNGWYRSLETFVLAIAYLLQRLQGEQYIKQILPFVFLTLKNEASHILVSLPPQSMALSLRAWSS